MHMYIALVESLLGGIYSTTSWRTPGRHSRHQPPPHPLDSYFISESVLANGWYRLPASTRSPFRVPSFFLHRKLVEQLAFVVEDVAFKVAADDGEVAVVEVDAALLFEEAR